MSENVSDDAVRQVERDGLVLDVVDEGPRDGAPIVLLHGFPERATCWRKVAPLLHAEGYRTLAVDQRGYAPGARPTRRRDYKTAELAADVVAVIDQLVGPGASAHVVGHDWGAIVAWAVAQRHPESVRSLTAVSVTHPGAFLRAMYRSTQGLKSWYMAMFQIPGGAESLARTPVFAAMLAKFGMRPEEVERCRREVVDTGALKGGLMYYRALPLNDPREMRVPVRVPTTLVWSDRDAALGRWGAEHAVDHVAGPYRFVELKEVSHWIPTQAPDDLADAILHRVRSVEQ